MLPDKLSRLINNFNSNIAEIKRNEYKEMQLRNEYINPFFELLGWDIRNEQGRTIRDKDVLVEETTKEGRPDYSFRVGGKTKFLVEVKKPIRKLKEEHGPAQQIRRYGWTSKVPICILTDFEEFIVYDCRVKPEESDPASVCRDKYFVYEEWADNFEWLWDTFSRERVLNGSLDEYTENIKVKTGIEEVDVAFLNELEQWREILAKNITLRNPKLISVDDLSYIVQILISRIVFLRICEDRGIEDFEQLKNLIDTTDIYSKLNTIFFNSKQKYNSELFNNVDIYLFAKDEEVCLSDGKRIKVKGDPLVINDEVFKHIFKRLYPPKCPYEFSIFPADILGQVYEQFLGKVIRISETHRAVIEYKPEVRKAGGVYYTPTYIVDYIVENTVGKILEEKTLTSVKGLSILDPACGSGSFLINAYQYLLDWYLQKYIEKGTTKNKIFQRGPNDWRLTIKEKKRILLEHIYGVDIDFHAVEVTKLSLLLKVLEGEDEQNLRNERQLFNEPALPDLSNNIKCGNSLIGSDYFDNKPEMIGTDEHKRINPLDWEKQFPEIMLKGGFDAVIGNPPWIFTKYFDWGQKTKEYIEKNYLLKSKTISEGKARQSGKINIFGVFLIKSIDKLLTEKGLFSFILPNTILRTTIYDIIRKFILDETNIIKIVDLKSGVFKNVTASTIIIILEKSRINELNQIQIIDQEIGDTKIQDNMRMLKQNEFKQNISYAFSIFTEGKAASLFGKINKNKICLNEIMGIFNGIATKRNKEGLYKESINDKCKKILLGKDVKRYYHSWTNNFIEYDKQKLHRARKEGIFLTKEKLIMQRIGGILVTSYDDEQYYTFNSINNLLMKCNTISIKFALSIINSSLMKYYYINNFTNKSSLTVNIAITFLNKIPLPFKELKKDSDFLFHNSLVSLVSTMLNLQKKYHSAQIPPDKENLKNQIDMIDKQIDNLVYKLYDLTEEEIKIVEESI